MHGNRLIYSDPQYVATLHTGVLCILLGVFLLIAGGAGLLIAQMVVEEYWGAGHWTAALIESTMAVGNVGLSFLSVAGWWLFSTPDQAIIGHDTGDRPRRVLRVAVVISALVLILDAVGEFWLYQFAGSDLIAALGSMAGTIAWLVSFFASLLYVRWLARRLPNHAIQERATQYLWLLPIVFIVGMCILIGPLVATVMYLVLLYDVAVNLRIIMRRQREVEAARS